MYYSNYEEGVTIESLKGRVNYSVIGPGKILQIAPVKSKSIAFFETNTVVDEYSLLPWEDEKARLADYARPVESDHGTWRDRLCRPPARPNEPN
jgi:hypothetical protein